jgi:hypothetical protein
MAASSPFPIATASPFPMAATSPFSMASEHARLFSRPCRPTWITPVACGLGNPQLEQLKQASSTLAPQLEQLEQASSTLAPQLEQLEQASSTLAPPFQRADGEEENEELDDIEDEDELEEEEDEGVEVKIEDGEEDEMEVEEVDEDEDDDSPADSSADPIGSDAAHGRRATITQPAKRQKVEEAAQAPMQATETGGAPFITVAGGYNLILSSQSITGYKGVCFVRKAYPSKPFQMNHTKNGKQRSEFHKTAVEAAIAYARHVGVESAQREQDGEDEDDPYGRTYKGGAHCSINSTHFSSTNNRLEALMASR